MKNITSTLNSRFVLRTIFTLLFLTSILSVKSQPPFEKHYGLNTNGNESALSDFVTCESIDVDYVYLGVQAFNDQSSSPNLSVIRGVRIKADGTMLSANFDFIKNSSSYYNIFPLKIIPINNSSEYLITGYVTHVNAPNLPFPFIIKADNNLSATDFKIITDHNGFFSDVDELLPSGDLLFSGSVGPSLIKFASFRHGWIMRTDNTNFTAQWMRFIHFDDIINSKSYGIVNDAIAFDDDSAIICGSVSELFTCTPADSLAPRAFIAKINLTDGSFYWHKAVFKGCFSARLAINDANTLIALATNGEVSQNYIGLNFFDRGGNFISRKLCETFQKSAVNFTFSGSTYSSDIKLHIISLIQNIYFNSNDEDVFVSGKFVDLEVNIAGTTTPIGTFEMPYSMLYIASSANFDSINLYKSAQQFQVAPANFLSYDFNTAFGCPGQVYPPLFVSSNTLPCLSNCGSDEYVTITLDEASDANTQTVGQDKVWIFSDDNYVCGYELKRTSTLNIAPNNHINLENDNVEVPPNVEDAYFNNSSPTSHLHNCEQ